MRRIRNRTVVCPGEVGRNTRHPSRKGASRRVRAFKRLFACACGPWRGYKLCLSEDGCTLPIVIGGVAGQYRGGNWVSA